MTLIPVQQESSSTDVVVDTAAEITTAFANADGSYNGKRICVLPGTYAFTDHLVIGEQIKISTPPGVIFTFAAGKYLTTKSWVDGTYYANAATTALGATAYWDGGNTRFAKSLGDNFPADVTGWSFLFAGNMWSCSGRSDAYITISETPAQPDGYNIDGEKRYFGLAKMTCKNVVWEGEVTITGEAGHDSYPALFVGVANCDFGGLVMRVNLTDTDAGGTPPITNEAYLNMVCMVRVMSCFGFTTPKVQILNWNNTYLGGAAANHTGIFCTNSDNIIIPDFVARNWFHDNSGGAYGMYLQGVLGVFCGDVRVLRPTTSNIQVLGISGAGNPVADIKAIEFSRCYCPKVIDHTSHDVQHIYGGTGSATLHGKCSNAAVGGTATLSWLHSSYANPTGSNPTNSGNYPA